MKPEPDSQAAAVCRVLEAHGLDFRHLPMFPASAGSGGGKPAVNYFSVSYHPGILRGGTPRGTFIRGACTVLENGSCSLALRIRTTDAQPDAETISRLAEADSMSLAAPRIPENPRKPVSPAALPLLLWQPDAAELILVSLRPGYYELSADSMGGCLQADRLKDAMALLDRFGARMFRAKEALQFHDALSASFARELPCPD